MLSSYELNFTFQDGHLRDTTFSFAAAGRYYMIDISINRYDVILISISTGGYPGYQGVYHYSKKANETFKT